MERRKFLTISMTALPVLSFSQLFAAQNQQSKAIVLKQGESRFGFPTPFLGVNPNDLKV